MCRLLVTLLFSWCRILFVSIPSSFDLTAGAMFGFQVREVTSLKWYTYRLHVLSPSRSGFRFRWALTDTRMCIQVCLLLQCHVHRWQYIFNRGLRMRVALVEDKQAGRMSPASVGRQISWGTYTTVCQPAPLVGVGAVTGTWSLRNRTFRSH